MADKSGVYVLVKGENDFLYCPDEKTSFALSCYAGSGRRCGGQGDLLAGALGTILSWMPNSHADTLSACQFASNLTRRTNELAFEKYNFSATTSDMIPFISKAFIELLSKDSFE